MTIRNWSVPLGPEWGLITSTLVAVTSRPPFGAGEDHTDDSGDLAEREVGLQPDTRPRGLSDAPLSG